MIFRKETILWLIFLFLWTMLFGQCCYRKGRDSMTKSYLDSMADRYYKTEMYKFNLYLKDIRDKICEKDSFINK